MQLAQWKKEVWPFLPSAKKNRIIEEVKALKRAGWSHEDAWVQAASTC